MSHGGGNGLGQTGFRGRNDDGNETTATWIAGTNVDFGMRPGRIFRIRLLVEATSLFLGVHHLYFAKNGGAFAQCTSTSNPARVAESTFYNNGDFSTQQIGSGPFVGGNPGMANNNLSTGTMSYESPDPTLEGEAEWCVVLTETNVSDGDTIQFHAQFGAATFTRGYFETPNIYVDMPRTIRRTIFIE